MSVYWDNFYKNLKGNNNPSKFAKFCLKYLKKFPGNIYDAGCGNGRDTIFFNQKKLNCIGIDQSKKVIGINKKKNNRFKKNFIKKNFVNFDYSISNDRFAIYSRFSIHSINYKQEKKFFNSIKKFKNLEYVFIETRTIYDNLFGKGKRIGKNEYINTHYRRFINPTEFKRKLAKDFNIIVFKLSKNLAPFKGENPVVLRIVAKRKKIKK